MCPLSPICALARLPGSAHRRPRNGGRARAERAEKIEATEKINTELAGKAEKKIISATSATSVVKHSAPSVLSAHSAQGTPLQFVRQTPITGLDDLVLRAAPGVVALRNQAADGRTELRAGRDPSRWTRGDRTLWRFSRGSRARPQARAQPPRRRMGASSRRSTRPRAQRTCGLSPSDRAIAIAVRPVPFPFNAPASPAQLRGAAA